MIYGKEIEKAIDWLFKTQNKENFGWSWVSHISPNEQNTAEVVYSTLQFSPLLKENQKLLLNEAVKNWLLMPQKHAVLTIDWVWVGMALYRYFRKYHEMKPDFDIEFVSKDVGVCVEYVLKLQNKDGGWGDYVKDLSTTFRTALAVMFLYDQKVVINESVVAAVDNGIKFLLSHQNEDGGFGNISNENLTDNVLKVYAGVEQDLLEIQYKSSVAATGYALIALARCNKHLYNPQIEKACGYLKNLEFSKCKELFLEVGIRRNTLFTFRHFSAVWMGIGMLDSGKFDFMSEEIIRLIKYFLTLQDDLDGGFKANETSEVYTWSDCNIIMFFKKACEAFYRIKGVDYTDMILDYLMNKN